MRQLLDITSAMAVQDGDGVNIHRVAGQHLNAMLDPFLMVDEINSDDAADYIGGFPEHPHRGFETITYMKAGRMRHRDHMGNEGVIEAGDVQWMTAGKGVLHSEMPEQDSGLLHGFQIWLNLPAAEKMKPAAYRDLRSKDIAEQRLPGGGLVRVISGTVSVAGQSLTGPLPAMTTEPVLIDVKLQPNESADLIFKAANPAKVYVYHGDTDTLPHRHMGNYSSGETLQLQAGSSGASMLVLSGQPIREPIVQYGPFVMNTAEQINQAIQDFQTNRLV